MSEIEREKQEWTDPKDFGLAFVTLDPLNSSPVSDSSPSLFDLESNKQQDEAELNTELSLKNPEAPKPPNELQKIYPLGEKETSFSWVWITLILVGCAVGLIYWWLQREHNKVQVSVLKNELPTQSIPKDDSPQPADELIGTEENQLIKSKDSTLMPAPSSTLETTPGKDGTTIALKKPNENLIRIDSRDSNPRYFIVVASVPTEKLALEQIEEYSGKSPEFYLITPYETSKNFRIATSKFDTWKAASEEKTRIKAQFSEDLWILNY